MKTGTKIAVWIIIIIATAAFLCLGLAVTMMLAPGLEIFGVKYVSAKVGKYKFSNNVKYSASNIILNTGDVPIEITYGMSGSLGLEFVQNFQGFTKSADTAGVKSQMVQATHIFQAKTPLCSISQNTKSLFGQIACKIFILFSDCHSQRFQLAQSKSIRQEVM